MENNSAIKDLSKKEALETNGGANYAPINPPFTIEDGQIVFKQPDYDPTRCY